MYFDVSKVVSQFFENEEKESSESDSITSEESELNQNDSNIEDKKTSTVKLETNNTESKPSIPPKPSAESIRLSWNLSSRISSPECHIKDLDDSDQRSSTSLTPKCLLFNRNNKREHVRAEYGYLSQIPIGLDEAGEEKQTEPKNTPIKAQKWARQFIVLFSDNSIGICSNKDVNKKIIN